MSDERGVPTHHPSVPLDGPTSLVPPEAPWPPAAQHPLVLVVRVALAVMMVVGLLQTLSEPAERSVEHLLEALYTGQVTSVTIERPHEDAQAHGSFRVEWSGTGRPGYASYEYRSAQDGSAPPVLDEGRAVLETAARTGTPVLVTHSYLGPQGTTWHLMSIGGIGAFLLLVLGPQPRLATKWAWFWLCMYVPPLWLVFVVLEPTPWWVKGQLPPAQRRLTGGWAFLLGLLLAPTLASSVPGYAAVFP
ncbi:hypothetical protein [Actinotalea sp. K2]|uniref:hypothetical protein n=1 Tax=Actinotalea sp. K2 TaxID=2939438 RepID=UPI002017F6C3|nr:hypothetical protein [Actinotalea sp. K2]MCL3860974.1 hypothetical protein [Actinotalea sp. K2]